MPGPSDKSFTPKFETELALEILEVPELRISSASFTRIRDDQGRFALLVNKNRAEKGDIVLSPIGGALEATPEGIDTLKSILEIDNDAFQKGNDLRFMMSGARANELRTWFLNRTQRESDPTREIVEELVEEAKLLDETDLEKLEASLAGYATMLAHTSRKGQEGKTTLRLLEIFDIQLPSATLEKLTKLAQDPDEVIKFVTEEEIMNEQTDNGMQIAEISQSLLKAKQTIPEFE